MPKVGVMILSYHATQYLPLVLKSYQWVDKIVVMNYRFRTVEETTDNTKEIASSFKHPCVFIESGHVSDQAYIRNRALELLQDCDVVFISDADELIHPDDQQKIVNSMVSNDAWSLRVSIVDYNGDLYHASPKRGHHTLVAVNPNKVRLGSIRNTVPNTKGIICPEITMQHLGLVFTPETIDWKSRWEYKEEGHSRDKLLADWKITREVTPPDWLVELLR